MADNSPAFQYYPADLISDPEVMFWDMEAVGCYWQMITFLWLNGGKFEFNLENLCKLFRKNHKKTAEKLWEKIEKKFVVENGIVTHKRILKEMLKQAESKAKRQEAGKKGAEKRWNEHDNVNGNAIKKTMAKNGSSSSSSSSDNSIYSKSFRAFWEAYPRRSKPSETYEVFKKINPDEQTLQHMLLVVKAQTKSAAWKKDDGQWIPSAINWLQGEGWKNFKIKNNKSQLCTCGCGNPAHMQLGGKWYASYAHSIEQVAK